MCNRQQCIDLLKQVAPFIQSEFGVTSLQMFGSMARGDDRDDSDVDIFVNMPAKAMLLINLKDYLQELLGRTVDVVRSHSHLDPFLINEINRDGIVIIA